jgi:hypothetical protein
MEANAVKKQKEDKRNIYLMKEGGECSTSHLIDAHT